MEKKMYLSSGEVLLPATTPFQSISLFKKKREEIILHALTTRMKAKSKTKGTMASMVYHALTKCRTKILGFD